MGGSPFYEVISQKIFNFTNDGFSIGLQQFTLDIPALPLSDHLADRLVLLHLMLLEPSKIVKAALCCSR